VPTGGFALIDGEGNLHFIAEQPNEVLWMKFAPEAGDVADDPAAEEAPAEDPAA
jgi:hypothetical protein